MAYCITLPKHGKVAAPLLRAYTGADAPNATDIYGLKRDRTELAKDPAYFKKGEAAQIVGMGHVNLISKFH